MMNDVIGYVCIYVDDVVVDDDDDNDDRVSR